MRNPGSAAVAMILLAVVAPQLSGQTGAARLNAAVLEFADQWTGGATGAARLLTAAAMKVVPLDLTRPPTELGVDLIVFGSFVNNDKAYRGYVKQHALQLQRFVEQGGVVLEMTQSDQHGATVAYLPDALHARRTDTDLHPVQIVAKGHALLAGWTVDGAVKTHQGRHAIWESSSRGVGSRCCWRRVPGQNILPCSKERMAAGGSWSRVSGSTRHSSLMVSRR